MKAKHSLDWDWTTSLLLIAVVFTAAIRLEITGWTPDLTYVTSVAMFGSLLGLALGLSQFEKRGLNWLIMGYTLVILPAQLSNIVKGEETALGQLASLGGRLAVSFNLLFAGKAIEDHVFFVSLMALLFWTIGIYNGFRLIRRPAILPILLPSLIPVLIIQYYDGYNLDRIWNLALYFFLALMIIGRLNLLKLGQEWEEHRVLAGSEPEFDLSKNMFTVAAITILVAWLLPTPSAALPAAARLWDEISEPFDQVRHNFNDILAALDGKRSAENSGELYGNSLGLGRTAGTGTAELFSVSAPPNNLPRLYWRVRVYDTYQNGSWQTSTARETPFEPKQGDLARTNLQTGPTGEFTFTWENNQSGLLVTPAFPIWASRAGWIQTLTMAGSETDLLNWSASPSLRPGDRYQVRGLLLNPTMKALSSAGEDYPDWVRKQYLQMPKDISPEIKRLADNLTNNQTTPFDKAEAITNYLRQNISYSETVPNPPPGTDPIVWFLFGWKSGFCNYYASSEVLLLRSVGIPARIVVGYAQGESKPGGIYSIRGQDAHAWPEIYFPGIGWVEFEPTVNQLAIARPSGDQVASGGINPADEHLNQDELGPHGALKDTDPGSGTALPETTFGGLAPEQWLWVIIIASFLVGTSVLIWQLEQRKHFVQKTPRALKAVYRRYNLKAPSWLEKWAHWSEVTAVERAFHAINQALHWLKRPQPDDVTPAERANLLKTLLPNMSTEIETLTTALEETLYSPRPPEATLAIRAGWKIRIETLRLILRRFSLENRNE